MADYSKTIDDRQSEMKKELLRIAEEIPIESQICKKAGVGRSTFYKWLSIDKKFADEFRERRRMGYSSVSDKAESNILKKIWEGDIRASIYWLNHHRDAYVPRWDIHGNFKLNHELNEFEAYNRKIYPKSQL